MPRGTSPRVPPMLFSHAFVAPSPRAERGKGGEVRRSGRNEQCGCWVLLDRPFFMIPELLTKFV